MFQLLLIPPLPPVVVVILVAVLVAVLVPVTAVGLMTADMTGVVGVDVALLMAACFVLVTVLTVLGMVVFFSVNMSGAVGVDVAWTWCGRGSFDCRDHQYFCG